MIRLWLGGLTRKLLSGRQLRTVSRPARRPGARPCVEELEDRTLTSTVNLEPPGLLATSQIRVVPISYDETQGTSGESIPAIIVDARGSADLGGPGSGQILPDARDLAAPPAGLPNDHATADLPVTPVTTSGDPAAA